MTVRPSIPLVQLFLQVMVLLSKALHHRSKGLYLSFKGSNAWLLFVIVVGCHRASEYHTTFCLANGNMAVTVFVSHKRCQLMMPKIISKLHSPYIH